jgi:hypothetical protein
MGRIELIELLQELIALLSNRQWTPSTGTRMRCTCCHTEYLPHVEKPAHKHSCTLWLTLEKAKDAVRKLQGRDTEENKQLDDYHERAARQARRGQQGQ